MQIGQVVLFQLRGLHQAEIVGQEGNLKKIINIFTTIFWPIHSRKTIGAYPDKKIYRFLLIFCPLDPTWQSL
jgi:hypothetical protein